MSTHYLYGNVQIAGTLSVTGTVSNLTFNDNTLSVTGKSYVYGTSLSPEYISRFYGGTGSQFAIGIGDDSFGVANDALNYAGTGYVTYSLGANRIHFNINNGSNLPDAIYVDENGIVLDGYGTKIHTSTTEPTGTYQGQIYYNTSDDSIYRYNGAVWLSGASSNYKVYTAILNQTDTGNPTPSYIIENTLPVDISWSYSGVGYYIGTSTGSFTDNKTIASINGVDSFQPWFMYIYRIDQDNIQIRSYDSGATPAEFNGTFSVEIKVYN